MGIIEKIFGTHSEHELKRIYPIVDHIDALEPEMQKLSDEELKEKTKEFKERLAKGETLDDLLPEAFAVVREAAVRVLGMRHYRVQMVGGIILHQGRIAEMKTGDFLKPGLDPEKTCHLCHPEPDRPRLIPEVFQPKCQFVPYFICHQLVVRTLEHIADPRPLLPHRHRVQLPAFKQYLSFPFPVRCHRCLKMPQERRFAAA